MAFHSSLIPSRANDKQLVFCSRSKSKADLAILKQQIRQLQASGKGNNKERDQLRKEAEKYK